MFSAWISVYISLISGGEHALKIVYGVMRHIFIGNVHDLFQLFSITKSSQYLLKHWDSLKKYYNLSH